MPEAAWQTFRETYAAHLNTSKDSQVVAEKKAQELALAKLGEEGWLESRIGWVKQYAAPKMRTAANVRIFATGTWTDSQSNERTWTEADLDNLVAAFNAGFPGTVPIKAGHTADDFNSKIAEKLGVPVEVITGDPLGKGQVALGRMVTLERRGPLLIASFERVPEPIADFIEGGLYSTVSCEIEGPMGDFSDVLTAVALLGVEEPAVDEATLDRALVFGGKRENARVLSFATDKVSDADLEKEFNTFREKAEGIIKGMRGAPTFRAMLAELRKLFDQIKKSKDHSLPPDEKKEGTQMSKELETRVAMTAEAIKALTIRELADKFQAGDKPPTVGEIIKAFQEDASLVAVATALGLPEGATIEDVLAAIETLKGAGGGGGPAVPPGMQAEFTKNKTELAAANTRIAILEKKDTMHDYLEQTLLFSAIPGKSGKDIAEELVEIHYSQSKVAAEKMLTTYSELDKMGQAALLATGSSLPGAKRGDFEEEVTKYQTAHPTETRVQAVKATMTAHPVLYQALVRENRGQ